MSILPRWPGECAFAQQMNMKMWDALAGIRTAVDHDTVTALLDPKFFCEFARDEQQLTQNGPFPFGRSGKPRDHFLRHDQHVYRRLRIDVVKGDRGIVTLWVRAESEEIALARAKLILTDKRYASIGSLQSYAEALDNDPLACVTEEERAADRRDDSVQTGYDAIKEQALAKADGLHEVWLGPPGQQCVRQQKLG